MTVEGLQGRRLVVVGASAGLGRAVASRALRSGAEVILVARRDDRLRELIEEAGTGIAVRADITDPGQCDAIARAAASLGPIDLVINTTATSRLLPMMATTGEDWDAILRTNVVGVNQVIAALLPGMAPHGMTAVLSSESVDTPRAGLGAYGASKAALESSLHAWRAEHAPMRFTCVAIGATVPTEVADGYDPELMGVMSQQWLRHGLIQGGFMHTDEVALSLLEILASVLANPSVGLEHLLLRSPAPVISDFAELLGESAPNSA